MFEQGRFLSSFLFQIFRDESNIILISLNIGRENYAELRSACSQKRTCVCRARLLVYFFSIYVISSTRLPLIPSFTWISVEVLCQVHPCLLLMQLSSASPRGGWGGGGGWCWLIWGLC